MGCDALECLIEAIHRSTTHNVPQLFIWQWWNWESIVGHLFKSIPQIQKYHHFRFDASNQEEVYIKFKEHTNSSEKEISSFKKGKQQKYKKQNSKCNFSSRANPEKQEYLYKEVRLIM